MPPRRAPNFLHLLLFLLITLLAFFASEGLIIALHHGQPLMQVLLDARTQILANMLTYLLALAGAGLAFPHLWDQSFIAGIRWNRGALRVWLIPVGLLLGLLVQAATSLLPTPKGDIPIEDLVRNPALIWILVLFGTLLAPVFEEIVFRGFLLPSLALAVDYLRLHRSLDALDTWRSADTFSAPALVASSLLTSLLFALIHAPQLGYTWSAVSLLVLVSLILCFVRIRLQSVAASTVLHACYNLSVFLTLFFVTGGFRHLERV